MNEHPLTGLAIALWVAVGIAGAFAIARRDREPVSLLHILGGVVLAPMFVFLAVLWGLSCIKVWRRRE